MPIEVMLLIKLEHSVVEEFNQMITIINILIITHLVQSDSKKERSHLQLTEGQSTLISFRSNKLLSLLFKLELILTLRKYVMISFYKKMLNCKQD